jgi:hypothetical protein
MTVQLVKRCNECGYDESPERSLNEFQIQLLRNGHPVGRTELFHLHNHPCYDRFLSRLLQSASHDKLEFTNKRVYRKRSAPRAPTIEVGR